MFTEPTYDASASANINFGTRSTVCRPVLPEFQGLTQRKMSVIKCFLFKFCTSLWYANADCSNVVTRCYFRKVSIQKMVFMQLTKYNFQSIATQYIILDLNIALSKSYGLSAVLKQRCLTIRKYLVRLEIVYVFQFQ